MQNSKAYTRGLPRSPNWLQAFFRQYTFLALVALSIIAGIMFGATVAYQASMTDEAQQVAALATFRPNLVTRVIADDGKTVLGEFSLERRVPVTYDQIPERLKQAVWAIEDDRFFQHIGVDPIRIAMAAYKNFVTGRRAEGASTLTQQLAKILFLSPEKTYTRKLKEALVAMQIERFYTKEQIMEMYCNQIFLGGGAYGFEAAAQYYFSKSLKDLTLEECALLAGLPQAPSLYSPTRDEKAPTERRNVVLYRMKEAGYISETEYERARATRIHLNVNQQRDNNNSIYGYFVEEVRQEAEDTFGTRQTQTGGMNIYTTLDAKAQREAVRAVRRGLHAYQDRHGKRWKGNLINVLEKKLANDVSHYVHPDWLGDYVAGEYLFGLVNEVEQSGAKIGFGSYSALIDEGDTRWAGGPPAKLLQRGDLAVFRVNRVDEESRTLEVTLDQLPPVEGALVCIESKSGEVKAMVGGYDFSMRKFNNATQAERQTGSVFKPFLYAAAIEAGFTTETVINAGPFVDSRTGWSPRNYDGSNGGGMIPLRGALQHSLNVAAVRLMAMVGVDRSAEVVKRFGLPNPMKRVLPSALGATEEPLMDMVSAYSAFSNQGVRVKPHLIKRVTDSDGNVLQESPAQSFRVISGYVAAQMQDMMRGVVTGGTAGPVMGNKELSKRWICGKTGTVNDFTDAWFIGYTPSYTAGVWIGYPGTKRSLGAREAGGVAALPMWIQFMDRFLADKPNDRFPKAPPPDRDVLARRNEVAAAIRKAAAEEAESTATDEMADSAKSLIQGSEPAASEPPRKPVPRMVEPMPDAPRVNREAPAKPPAKQQEEKEKKKRGKNG